jgi:DNA-binding CsgD family transcriptional regulator
MKEEVFRFIQKKWQSLGSQENLNSFKITELDIHKMTLNWFHVGEFYYFLFSPPTATIEFVSNSVAKVTGFKPDEINIRKLMNDIHPNDFHAFLTFEKEIVHFKSQLPPEQIQNYKSQYNFRIKKKDGNYLHILHQSVTVVSDDTGAVLTNLVVHTDISNIKNDYKKSLSFIGLNGQPSFYGVKNGLDIIPTLCNHPLTKREREILMLISQNKNAKMIAKELFISVETVRTHRKNMLLKTGTNSKLELVLLGKKLGWL